MTQTYYIDLDISAIGAICITRYIDVTTFVNPILNVIA